ncbi:PREDICTED: aquaporin-4 [Rhagoletis zephyria]|uniref:aquaporin-4 n=1 Tax=Rhagoletis zephyria TaxID=28612 RepID=UPI0008119742|nr:PREDICTED: aquaporin-4 [Rhagoletis zephyria]
MAIKFMTIMRYLGEFFASALMVALSCLGCADGSEMPKLQYGLVVMIIIHCFGFVSGGHANPCITVACYMMRYISLRMAMMYMLAQFLGALTGYFLLTTMLPTDAINKDLCLMKPNGSLSWDQTFVIELVLTTTLIFGWCALWDARNSSYLDSVSLRIGLLVAACSLAGGQWTGAAMNPAITLIPAAYHQKFDDTAVYLASQYSAGIFAPVLWKLLFSPRSFFNSSKAC